MHAVRLDQACQFDVIVDDQRHVMRDAQSLQCARFGQATLRVNGFVAVLHQASATEQRLRDGIDQIVARTIGDDVETARG
jgi:hypothetical protein